jgi:hypothetical protein
MRKLNFYKKLIDRVKSIVRASRVPRSFSKKNNNVFSNEKHIIITVLMQLEKKHYRDMPSFLRLLQKEIVLRRIPCFSTINKFVLRVKPLWLEQLIARIVKSEQTCLVAIDGTGFSLNFRSPYFSAVAGEINQYLQCVAAASIKPRLIAAVRLRRKKRNENIDVPYLMEQSAKQLKIDYFLGDKGFDSEKHHERAEKYNAKFIAPIKKMKKQGFKIRGHHRKALAVNFPREIYNQRAIIESIFSVINHSRRFKAQKNEILLRIIAYNIEKILTFCVKVKLLYTKPQ